MSHQNTSDMIEAYLKKILEESEMIEIRRAEMADLFNCVPSQINYVINTRFTVQRGYTVESKRGGGGYIRIEKVQISNYHQFLEQVNQLFDQSLSEKDGIAIIQKLYEEGILSRREGNLLLVTVSKVALGKSVKEENIRANIMHGVLERLSYEL
ncbi:MAG: CtsR family transcriptional regulator [Tetragenococcus halophilus]|uniref:Transcriptional regulator CtsR n=1 Tax=Tetragenococcus halophilus TaxID=51669 RepID=A0AB35HQ24_TETHA|nr:CtsR family transcriptional regulator [Tetragenococcus halophilus]MCF1601596.1 CtsR family transcriptional regulator [Tetragenococcus halophilus]MCF1674860.1 CtsR family transcriptional regulator [Tetragenococcus halophilus]MCO8289796.1 CtsR family transcriptional regulator [Tetragenococcus halophilus]MCO8290833.1 CtsR family transcriptional regulator [Tetragenococcus halophilus]MCO8295039.1 CtsR family transcriptional regulator [Tetragenococcus halophilus]